MPMMPGQGMGGQMPPQGQIPMQSEGMPGMVDQGGEQMLSGDQIKQAIDQMLKQLPPEALQQIAQMDQVTAVKKLMELFVQQGLDKPIALELAGTLYEAILANVQQSTNSTLGMINPNLMKQDNQPQPQGQPSIPSFKGR